MTTDPLAIGLDLEDVRQRIQALRYFKSVTDVLNATDAIEEVAAVPPAAYISIASETAGRNDFIRGSGGHRQRVTSRLSILFVESSARFDRDPKRSLERTRLAVIRQLIGWKPAGAIEPLDFDRYLLRATGGGLVWGECLFLTSWSLSTG